MSPFYLFSILLTLYFSSFILSTITYPVLLNATSPKAPPRLLNFRLHDCLTVLRSDTQRLHLILYLTCSTKVFSVSNKPRRLRTIQCCVFSSSRIVCHRLLASTLSSSPLSLLCTSRSASSPHVHRATRQPGHQ